MRDSPSEPADSDLPTLDQLLEFNPQDMSYEQLRAYIQRSRALSKKDFAQILRDESNGLPEHQGFIYILSNPAMPGLSKIGSTEGPVRKRVMQLNSPTGVPDSFKIEAQFPVYTDPRAIEKAIHQRLDIFRLKNNREFFRLMPEYAIHVIQSMLTR